MIQISPVSFGGHVRLSAFVIMVAFYSAVVVAQNPQDRLQAADTSLNQAYSRIMRKAPEQVAAALRESEHRWIAFRDANAALAARMRPSDPLAALRQRLADTTTRRNFLEGNFEKSPAAQGDRDNAALQEADQQLKAELAAIHSVLDGEDKKALEASQTAWEAVRDLDIVALTAVDVVRNANTAWAVRRLRATGRLGFLRTLRAAYTKDGTKPPSAPPRPVDSAKPPARTKLDADARLKPIPEAVSETQAEPTVANPMQVFTRIATPKQYHGMALDMREMLLVRTDQPSMEFWDVQTGGLIRTVYPSLSAGKIESLGGGFVAVQSLGRRAVDFEIFHRNAPEARNKLGIDYFDGYGLDPRPISAAKECRLVALLVGSKPKEQHLWLGAPFTSLNKLALPELAGEESWKFVELAHNGQSIAVASEAKVAVFRLPEGNLSAQFHLPDGAMVTALASDNRQGFLAHSTNGHLYRWDSARRQVDRVCNLSLNLTPPMSDGEKEHVSLTTTPAGWSFASCGRQIAFSPDAPENPRKLISSWHAARPFVVDASGEYAAVRGEGPIVEIYHLPSGQLVRTLGTASPKMDAVLSADGQRIVRFSVRKAGLLEITMTELAKASYKNFEVTGFEEVFAVDGSGKHAVLGTRVPPTTEATAEPFIVGYGRVRKTIGLLDLETGTVTLRTLPPDVQGWRFSMGNALLAGLSSSHGTLHSLIALDIEEPDDKGFRRIPLPQLPAEVAPADRILSMNRDASKLAFAKDESIYVLDVEKTGPASVRKLEKQKDYSGFQEAAFSTDGNRIACFVETDKWGGGEIRLIDIRRPGQSLWTVAHGIRTDFAAFVRNDRYILIGGEDAQTYYAPGFNLELLDTANGRRLSSIRLLGSLASVAGDGSRVLVNSSQGGYEMVDVRGDQLVATMRYVPGADGGYALILPDGHYLSTTDAHSCISFATGGRSQTAESLDIKYNRPDMVMNALGAAPELVRAFRRAYEKRLVRMNVNETDLGGDSQPPVVSIDYDKVPLTTAERVLRLPLDAKPGGAPLAALEVTVNDVPVLGRKGRLLAEAERGGFAADVEVELASGSNKVTVWTRDARGLTSSRLSVNVTLTALPPKQPTLYVLAVGIDDYPGENDDLKLARKDAMDIATVFEKTARPAFADVKTIVISQEKATRRGVLEASSFFAEAGVDDQVVLFMAGHGLVHDNEYRFCPADFSREQLSETTVTYGEIEGLLDACRARKRIVLLDTCQSGEPDLEDRQMAGKPFESPNKNRGVIVKPIDAPKDPVDTSRIADLLGQYFVDLRIGAGAAVLASSTAEQNSAESAALQNGLFTSAVIQGLQERKADVDHDGIVRVSELLRYCKAEVAHHSKGRQDPVARHVNLSEDFTVATFR